jgi:hypothetical protein
MKVDSNTCGLRFRSIYSPTRSSGPPVVFRVWTCGAGLYSTQRAGIQALSRRMLQDLTIVASFIVPLPRSDFLTDTVDVGPERDQAEKKKIANAFMRCAPVIPSCLRQCSM